MKKLIFISIIMMLITSFNSFSQEILDPPQLINSNTISEIQRNSNKFIKGFNYFTIGRKLDSAMFMNTLHSQYLSNASFMHQNGQLSVYANTPGYGGLGALSGGNYWDIMLQGRGFSYDPTIDIDSTDNYKLRIGDNLGGVFGFKYKNFGEIHPYGNPDFHRFVLRKAKLDSLGQDTVTVLTTPWPNNEIFMTRDNGGTEEYSTVKMYISLNLHVYGPIDTSSADGTVLSVRLPFLLNNDSTGFIKFYAIPSSLPYDTINVFSSSGTGNFRGVERKIIPVPAIDSIDFIITRKMLGRVSANGNITISAYFELRGLDSNIILKVNPQFKSGSNYSMADNRPFRINTLGINIMYHGVVDLGIQNVRLFTAHGKDVLFGQCDREIRDSIAKVISLFHILDSLDPSRHIKLHRFYVIDEMLPQAWTVARYFNKLCDGLATTETDHKYPAHFEYLTEFAENWEGTSIGAPGNQQCAPNIKTSLSSFRETTLGYQGGYEGYTGLTYLTSDQLKDTVNSFYETFFSIGDSIKPNPYPINWDNYLNNKFHGVQAYIEQQLYKDIYKRQFQFFSDKPFWFQIWGGTNWVTSTFTVNNTLTNKAYLTGNPQTGEVLNLICFYPLLFGNKGTITWQGATLKPGGAVPPFLVDNQGSIFVGYSSFFDLTPSTMNALPNGDTLLNSDGDGSIQGDFMRTTNQDLSDLNYYINTDGFVRWDLLGHDINHLYLGRRTQRVIHSRVNKLIDLENDLLLRLKLTSWYGKGFAVIRLTDTLHGFDSNCIEKFISLDSNKLFTRKVFDPDTSIGFNTLKENWRDSYFDISLLRDSSDHNLSQDTVYIAALSRRTDPLVFWPGETGNYLRFLTTMEFEDSCDCNKNPGSCQQFKDFYWKKLGARYLNLTFNYVNPNNPDEYCLLKVSELGANSAYLNNQTYFNEPYHHKIDTIVGQDSRLSLRLQPGQGVILRIQILHPPVTNQGWLAHSNQSKLICHPAKDSMGNIIDSLVRWYLVYFALKPGQPDKKGVFYRCSAPTSKNSPASNIVWEGDPVMVSQSVQRLDHTIDDNTDCDYPSIVVRGNLTNPYVYIVYSCYQSDDTNIIVENVFKADGGGYDPGTGITLAYYSGNPRSEYGNPVVSAVDTANIYAFSDNNYGIVAGWKPYNSRNFTFMGDTVHIDHPFNSLSCNLGGSKHPSLNVYSSLITPDNEDNSALVFQTNCNDANHVAYTRLRYQTGSGLRYYLPDSLNPGSFPIELNSDTSIALISYPIPASSIAFPVVIRQLKEYDFRPPVMSSTPPNRYDRVFWTSNEQIACRSIALLDSANESKTWSVFQTDYFLTYNYYLFYQLDFPTVSQGPLIADGIFLNNDIALNMVQLFYYYPVISGVCNVGTNFIDTTINKNILGLSYNPFISNGFLPHLALYPRNLSSSEVWKNRHIYEINGCSFFDQNQPIPDPNCTNIPDLMPSPKHFFKKTIYENRIDYAVGFAHDSVRNDFGLPIIDSKNITWDLPIKRIVDTTYGNKFIPQRNDTLYSSTFTLGASHKFSIKYLNLDSSRVRLFIQRLSDRNTVNFQLSPSSRSLGKLLKYTLTNGQNRLYRIGLLNRKRGAEYSQATYLNGYPVEDESLEKVNIDNENIIDLSTGKEVIVSKDDDLYIFPNPATNEATIIYNSDFYARICLYNVYGEKLMTLVDNQIKGRHSVNFNTSELLPGTYFIRLESFTSATTKNFVIER